MGTIPADIKNFLWIIKQYQRTGSLRIEVIGTTKKKRDTCLGNTKNAVSAFREIEKATGQTVHLGVLRNAGEKAIKKKMKSQLHQHW